MDCAGVCGGSAEEDEECLVCGGNGPLDNYNCAGQCIADIDCDGVCGGSAVEDECGVCGGNGPPTNYNCDLECTDGVDCNGVCGGSAVEDECDVCGGDGIPEGDCDCEGNVDLGCGCGEAGPSGCDDVCGSTATLDNCGTCDDNSSNDCVQDCNGDWGGSAFLDENCGEPSLCVGGSTGLDCVQDCTGVWGGNAIVDDCGDCVGIDVNYINENMDEFGTCCNLVEKDICGECGGTGIIEGNCDCDGNLLDCAGECGGSAEIDNCSVCNNYETQPEYPYGNCDCAENPNGIASIDNCGICDDNPSNDCTLDCLTIQDGPNIIDDCGTCDDNPDNNCIQDCAGLWGGSAVKDDCEICAGGTTGVESCVEDCIGTLGGTFWVSDCGCVEADNSGDECDDCAANPNGTAELDLCGNCIEEGTDTNFECSMDCDGVWGGIHPPTFTCENGDISCNYYACFALANNEFQLPQRFDINRIYPNPFNPQATIDFEVSEPTMVQLNIYNLRGQKVDVLIDSFTLPGHYSVNWNGSYYPSGIYFVILNNRYSIIRRKIILLK